MRKHYFAAGGSIAACLLLSLFKPVSAQLAMSESLSLQAFEALGGEVSSVAAVDLDGDRKPEAILGSGSVGSVQLLPILGKMTSNATMLNFGETGIADFSFRDINNDRKPDAVVVAGSELYVSLNQSTPGNILFAPAIAYTLPFTAKTLTIGDFNMSGYPEIAIAGEQTLQIISVSGDESMPVQLQSLTSLQFNAPVHAIRLADMNGDGNIDIVAGTATGLSVIVNKTAYGATTYQFNNPLAIGERQHVHTLDIADVNGDFMPDVVTGNYPSNTLSVWLNASSGSDCAFASPKHMEAMASYQVRIGDFNADGWFDIAAIPGPQDWPVMEIRLQNSDIAGLFEDPVLYTSAGNTLFVTDIDGDAKDDITTLHQASGSIVYFTQEPTAESGLNMTSTAFCNEEGAVQFDWMAGGFSAYRSFQIERSTDGQHFEEIGRLDVNGTDATKSYSFTYMEQGFEETCYRIVAVSATGARKEGNVMKVTPCVNVVQDFMCVFPNPVDQTMQFSYTVSHEVNMEYAIVDLNMRVHLNTSEMIAKGTGTTTVDSKNLPKGSYLFTVKFGNQPPQVCRFEKR